MFKKVTGNQNKNEGYQPTKSQDNDYQPTKSQKSTPTPPPKKP